MFPGNFQQGGTSDSQRPKKTAKKKEYNLKSAPGYWWNMERW